MSLHLIELGRPVLFVHIPKTGGTSIREGRTIVSEVSPAFCCECPSFAVLRNPLDRLQSAWKDFRFLRPRMKLELEPFIERYLLRARDDRILNPKTIEHHVAPMLHPAHGLRFAKELLIFDRFQDELQAFWWKHGLSTIELPTLRSTSKYPDPVWSNRARALVEDYCAEDFKLWSRHC